MTKQAKKQRVVPFWAIRAKALMQAHRITQQELADRLNLERNTLSHYLNGHREPDIETVAGIASILGVYTSQMLGEMPLTPDSEDTRRILQLWAEVGRDNRKSLLQIMEAGSQLARPHVPEKE
jgi:transcriptional regulator with XRE-family HTH domain